jgi:predicted glycoside hydrolase/deacetylase ChbG (UPF0249 family)
MRIILHADDLGISPEINDAIFALMEEEKITSTSIVANGPAFEDAARRVQRFPHCSVGVHLNITEFAPLRSCFALEPLLINGRFQKPGRGFVYERSHAFAIFREWAAQVRRVRESGIAISHLDSHHHQHTRFSLLSCLKQLCRAVNIRRVRIRHTFTAFPGVASWRIDNHLYNWRLRKNFVCADEFGSFAAFSPARVPPRSTVELMLHPGNPRYQHETQAFQEAFSNDFRRQHDCISYHDLN